MNARHSAELVALRLTQGFVKVAPTRVAHALGRVLARLIFACERKRVGCVEGGSGLRTEERLRTPFLP